MARSFNSATPDYFTTGSAVPFTAAPASVSCWIRVANVTGYKTALSLSLSGTQYFDFGTDDANVFCATKAPSFTQSDVGTVSANTWHHAGGVWASSTSRTAYLDGTAGTADTTSSSPSAPNTTEIGVLRGSADAFNGQIAEMGVWTVALTTAEMVILAKGASPLLVRPESLASYWPLIGRYSPEIDLVGRINLTASGAPGTFAHPRVFYPARHRTGFAASGAPPAGQVGVGLLRSLKLARLAKVSCV